MGKGTCLLIINGLHHLIVFLSATLCSPGVAYMLKVLAEGVQPVNPQNLSL